jgi:hypothetical protein
MRCSRVLPYLLTVAGVVLLTGALRGPGWRGKLGGEWSASVREHSPPSADFSGLEKTPADPGATALMDQALAQLVEPGLLWLEAGLWLRVHLPDLSFAAEGSYTRAPGHRFRLDLHTLPEEDRHAHSRKTVAGGVLTVSDGRDLWTASRLGEQWKDITRLRLSAILEGPQAPVSLPQVRAEFLAGPAFHGLELMMRRVHGHFDLVRREEHQGDVRLTGRWKGWAVASLDLTGKAWPEFLPRYCRLTLHGARLWPARIEWWGPMEEHGPDRLLAELEFRDPVFNRPLPESQCAGLFSFDPGAAPVEDITPGVHADLANRARQLSPSKR